MKLKTMMYHFRFYAVFVIWTLKNKNKKKPHTKKTREKKRKKKPEQKHYRCKAEVFFPQLYFFTLLQKVVFFNFSRTLTVMQNSGRRLSALRTQSRFRLLFLRFYQGFSKMELHSPFFCLNCTTVPLYTTF